MSTASSPPITLITDVRLRVHDLARQRAFYADLLGLRPVTEASNASGQLSLSADGQAPVLISLQEDSAAANRPAGSAGLFHTAFLYPDRASLGTAIRRLLAANYPVDGASDHGVSEAFYLEDPEGNGIELYADRPRDVWPMDGAMVAMFTRALDVQSILALGKETDSTYRAPAGLRVGHLHLNAGNAAEAGRQLIEALGLEKRTQDYPGAMFLAYDGYHHHVAVNQWGIKQPAMAGALGLVGFTLQRGITAAPRGGERHVEIVGVSIGFLE